MIICKRETIDENWLGGRGHVITYPFDSMALRRKKNFSLEYIVEHIRFTDIDLLFG